MRWTERCALQPDGSDGITGDGGFGNRHMAKSEVATSPQGKRNGLKARIGTAPSNRWADVIARARREEPGGGAGLLLHVVVEVEALEHIERPLALPPYHHLPHHRPLSSFAAMCRPSPQLSSLPGLSGIPYAVLTRIDALPPYARQDRIGI